MSSRADHDLWDEDNPWGEVQKLFDRTVRAEPVDALVLADDRGMPVISAGSGVDVGALSACCPPLARGTADARVVENLKGARKYSLRALEVEGRSLYLMGVYPGGSPTRREMGRVAEGTQSLLQTVDPE